MLTHAPWVRAWKDEPEARSDERVDAFAGEPSPLAAPAVPPAAAPAVDPAAAVAAVAATAVAPTPRRRRDTRMARGPVGEDFDAAVGPAVGPAVGEVESPRDGADNGLPPGELDGDAPSAEA